MKRLEIRFKHLLIDEFQDTSSTQWINLLPLISNGLAQGMESLVVGDAKQSIYSWRGGDPELLVDLPKLPKGFSGQNLVDHLRPLLVNKNENFMDRNFRSSGTIVEFNNEFFQWIKNRTSEEYPKLGKFYELHEQLPHQDFPGQVQLVQIKNDSEVKFEETALSIVPAMVEELKNKGFEYSEIAVLVRKNQQSRDVLEILPEARNSCLII